MAPVSANGVLADANGSCADGVGKPLHAAVPEPFPNLLALSPQERRIVALFALDYTIKEAARELKVQPDTIKTYTRRIYAKLGVRTKAGCVAVAYSRLLEP